jgi:ketosteroid isomerase-like protein
MTQPLPQALAAYYAAKNQHDIDRMLAPFADTATVRDEGEEMCGPAEIRAWMEETTRKYRVTVKVQSVERKSETYAVAAVVSGTFPGSPATLHYHFTLADGRIAHLEIGG